MASSLVIAAAALVFASANNELKGTSPSYPNPAWSKGWCNKWKQLPDQNQPGYKPEHGRTFFHRPTSPADCAAKCRAHPECTQAVYEQGGPWGQECWLGSQTSDKVHRASRGCSRQSGGPCVDHCYHATLATGAQPGTAPLCKPGSYHIGPVCVQCPTGKYSKGDAHGKGCSTCNGVTSFQPQRGQSGCLGVTSCGTGQYRAAHATSSANTLCRALTACSDGQWEARIPTDVSDRVCKPLTTCTDTQWEVRRPDGTHDRVCRETTRCRKGLEWELHAASTTSDRACTAQQPCPNMYCRIDGDGKLRVHHHHKDRRAGFKVHRCAFSKQIGRCICICNTHAIDPHYIIPASLQPSAAQESTSQRATTPPPATRSPTPAPTPVLRLTDAAQCKRWARLTSVVPTTLENGWQLKFDLSSASLSDAGKRVLQQQSLRNTALLRVSPGPRRSDASHYPDSSYSMDARLYIADNESPFLHRPTMPVKFGCGGACYDSHPSVRCANSADSVLKPAGRGHIVHNGGANAGKCAFGSITQRWDGNLVTWDVCAEFSAHSLHV